MSTFSDAQISKWAADYEKLICAKNDFICTRLSLQIYSGLSEYELPNYITNIRSILYQGKELHPKGGQASMMTGDTPFQTQGSIPFEYMFSNKGLRVIKFYPTPMGNIAEVVGDLWTPGADQNGIIVEAYRTSSSTDAALQMPTWVRRYILKDYICFKAFAAEGPQQDMRAAAYYDGRIKQQEEYLQKIKTNLHQAQVNVLYETKMSSRRKPGHPVLPTNFGLRINY